MQNMEAKPDRRRNWGSSFGKGEMMRVLTICQPYAHLIAHGQKWVENRTWYTPYRGELLIHAGKSRDWIDFNESETADETYGIPVSEMEFGKIVAVARLDDCIQVDGVNRTSFDRIYPGFSEHVHVEGPFCWVLTNISRLKTPLPATGKQGIFSLDLLPSTLGELIPVKQERT